MFSGRIQDHPAPRNALATLLDEKRAAGRSICDLTSGNPTQAGLDLPRDLLAPLADPAALVYEPAPRGLRSARHAVARACGADPDDLVLTASTSEAYSFLFKLLCDPGDVVLAPEPSYPLLAYLSALDGVGLTGYPLAYDGVWHIDLPALREAIAATPRARLLLIVSPNNPTGSYLKRDEWAAVTRLAAEHDLAIVVDEVFAEYPASDDPDPQRVVRAATLDPQGLVFSLGGLSKSCGLPQLKLGWICAGGPADVRRAALERLEIIADSYLSVSTPVMLAADRLLEAGARIRSVILDRVRGNLATIAATVAGTAATLLHTEGGWSAVLRLPATRSDEEVALALLRDHDVLVHPGYFFDFPRGTYLVISLLVTPSELERGLRPISSLAGGRDLRS